MSNRWNGEILRTILNIFRRYNGIDVLKLPFPEELYEKTFVVPYVLPCIIILIIIYSRDISFVLRCAIYRIRFNMFFKESIGVSKLDFGFSCM